MKSRTQNSQTHDFSCLSEGLDYILEVADSSELGQEYYLTRYGKGVKLYDYVILKHDSKIVRHVIKRIDYYSNPPDLWIALLVPCPD